MSQFIQSLESRTLFTGTTATGAALLADVKQVVSSAATARADLRSAVSAATTNTNTVAADLKTSTTSANRASNAGLLRTLRSDEAKTFATLRAAETALLVVGSSLSARAAADGKALLLHPTNTGIEARVTADTTALATVPAARLATLQADALNGVLGTDLTNLVNANPANTALATDTSAFNGSGAASAAIANAVTAAGTFTTATGTLNSDVNSTTTGSTIPNLVGTYVGSSGVDGTHNEGLPSTLVLDFTSEGADGSFTGTITTGSDGNTATTTVSLTGSVTADGSFNATAANMGGGLTGTVSGNTISGTETGSDGHQVTFTVTLQ